MIQPKKVEGSSEPSLEQAWEKWKHEGDLESRGQLIENYYPLVKFVSSRLSVTLPKNVSNDDLIGYGIMGLIDAVEKFDLQRGLRFETYASWRIKGAMIDALRQGDWVPRSVREKAKKMEDAYQLLQQKYLRNVTDEEISTYLNISLSEFQSQVQDVSVSTVYSLEDPIREEEAETRQSVLIDENAKNPEEKVNDLYLRQMLTASIERLTEKERTVVTLYYYEDLSLTEIAEVMSLTPSRISQLHSKAIARLRGSLDSSRGELLYRW